MFLINCIYEKRKVKGKKLLDNKIIEIIELTPECAFRIPPDLLPSSIRNGGQLTKNTAFALMTDGISANRKRYKEELALVLHLENWEHKFEEIMQLNQLTQFDDMTLLLLKN